MQTKGCKRGSYKPGAKLDRIIEGLRSELKKLSREGGDEYLDDDKLNSEGPKTARQKMELTDHIDRLLRLKEVLTLLPISKSTFYAGIKSGRYPAPVHHLGPRISAWWLSSIMRFAKGED